MSDKKTAFEDLVAALQPNIVEFDGTSNDITDDVMEVTFYWTANSEAGDYIGQVFNWLGDEWSGGPLWMAQK